MRFFFRFLSLLVTLLVLLPGCGGEDKPNQGSLIFGVTSDLRVGVDLLRLHVVRKIDGATVSDVELFSDGAAPFQLPLELRFDDLADGTDVEIDVEAFGSFAAPLVTRSAKSTVLAGKALLARVDLASTCAGSMAPNCGGELTCSGGICLSSYLSPALLEAYTSGWAKGKTDICKPGDGPPVVLVGKGQADYLPTSDYDLAQVEAGPQGGHHIWVALRMKNLRQSGSITKLSGYVKELDLELSPFTVIFTFDPDEGGYCKLYGLRFQLDGTVPVEDVLGKTVRVTAEVDDKDGDVGIGERWVTLSSTIL